MSARWAVRLEFLLRENPAKTANEVHAEARRTTAALTTMLETQYAGVICTNLSDGNVEAAGEGPRRARSTISLEVTAASEDDARQIGVQLEAAAKANHSERLDVTLIAPIDPLETEGFVNPATAAVGNVLVNDHAARVTMQTVIGSKSELDAAASVRDAVERQLANSAARVGEELRDALDGFRIEQVDWTDLARAVRLT